MFRWISKVEWFQGAKWRLTHFLNYAYSLLDDKVILKPVIKALETLKRHKERQNPEALGQRLYESHLVGLNGIFQAARVRARGYRNVKTFITMIYLLAAPIEQAIKST